MNAHDDEFVIVPHVPILDEHVLKDDQGNPVVDLDEAKLRHIAAVNNARLARTGDEAPVVIGHTKDEAPETSQPEVVGFARHFEVIPFFKTGKKCIAVTMRFLRRHLDKIRNYPRRSIELWISDWKIDPISLLGATTPERDLGLLRLSREGVKKYSRVVPETPMDTNVKEIVDAVMEALEESDVFQWCREQMGHDGAGDGMPDGAGADGAVAAPPVAPPDGVDGGVPGEGPTDGLPGMDGKGGPDDEPIKEGRHGIKPAKKMAGPAPSPGYASGTNTALPRYGDRNRMQKDSERLRLARVEGEKAALAKEVQALRIKFQRSERERDLIQLEGEGFDLDRVEELDRLQALPEDRYRNEVALIRKRYRKAPIGDPSWRQEHLRSQFAPQGRTKERAMEISNYAVAHGIDYATALAKLEGEG